MITNSHLKRAHGITTEEYREKFGADSFIDEDMRHTLTVTRYSVVRPECHKPGCEETVSQSWNKYCSYNCSMSHRMATGGRNEQAGSKGSNWQGGWFSVGKRNKRLAKERDKWTCRNCQTPVAGKGAHAHHIVPHRCFSKDEPEIAHALSNLVTLCDACHVTVEWDTFNELYDRALQLDKLLEDNPDHIPFSEYKDSLF
ncbi:MAG: HNH endonuclease [Sulfurovum sp.]|nr:HNH endonuclease [Sulfurovum sp.]